MDYSFCTFETERLQAAEWHSLLPGDCRSSGLGRFVQELLTESATAFLPSKWAGQYSLARARAWIADRDREGTVLLAVDRDTQEYAGVIILSRVENQRAKGAEVNVGYIVAEAYRGRGLATELLVGLVGWSREWTGGFLSGGVSPSNTSSIRVLEKAGFRRVRSQNRDSTELLYRLKLD